MTRFHVAFDMLSGGQEE